MPPLGPVSETGEVINQRMQPTRVQRRQKTPKGQVGRWTDANTCLRSPEPLTPERLVRLRIRMRRTAPRWCRLVALAAISVTTLFVDGLQYSVVSFVPFLLVMTLVYARTRGDGHA